MEESSEKKMVTVKSSNGETFEVEEKVALQSQTIKHMIEDGCAVEAIPIANVTSSILAKVIEYCKKHATVDNNKELKAWDAEFVKVDKDTLYALILTANYLDIKSLLDLTCQIPEENGDKGDV